MNIKPDLQKEYDHYVKINSDGYSEAVIIAGEKVMELLDEGKTPEEAGEGLHGQDLTGFMAGAAIQAVVHFHERGDEVKEWWNNRYGVKDAKGVVNPAIVTIKTK
jgi:hypothetical protein